jgi:hypothetical protein
MTVEEILLKKTLKAIFLHKVYQVLIQSVCLLLKELVLRPYTFNVIAIISELQPRKSFFLTRTQLRSRKKTLRKEILLLMTSCLQLQISFVTSDVLFQMGILVRLIYINNGDSETLFCRRQVVLWAFNVLERPANASQLFFVYVCKSYSRTT